MKKKEKKKGFFKGKPVAGSKSVADMKTMNFGVTGTVTTKKNKKTKTKKKRGKKRFTRFGRFKDKGKAKGMKKDLEKVGRDAKILTRKVRTRGGGPKIETSFSVYQKDKGEK